MNATDGRGVMDGQRFDDSAAGGRVLRVTVERGDITVRAELGARWTIAHDASRGAVPEVERDGDTVCVTQRGHGRLDVTITTPDLEQVDLRTGAGRVEASGTRGRARLVNGYGTVALHGAGGEAEIDTGAGDVDVEGFDGVLTASSGKGRVRIARLEGRATLSTGAGVVEIQDTEAQVRASSGSGDLALARVGGAAELTTGHGAVLIQDPRDLSARVTTAMGAITVVDGSARDLRLKSMMGEVRCSAALAPGRYELETALGAVAVDLQDDVAARVEAHTSFGAVRSDFPLVRVGRSGPLGFGGARMVGSIGRGAALVDLALRSSKGDITLNRRPAPAPAPDPAVWPIGEDASPEPAGVQRRASPLSPPSPAPPTPRDPRAQNPTLAVLEALARGEISPAEAEDLLSRRA